MRQIVLATVLLFLTGSDDEANRAELKALLGTWVAVSGEANGKAITKEELPVQWT